METQYAIIGRCIDQMTAMYRAMVETADPMVAIPQVMACKIRYVEADYRCEVAMAAEVKQGAVRDVMVQDVMTDC